MYSEENELLYLTKHKITEHMTTLEIIVDQKPSKAGIDPLLILIDRDGDDNVMLLEEQ